MDHYVVLGLPSGEEGARLSEQEITKAYRTKARELHPDKRRDDPNAHADFLKLRISYEVLKDEKKRKLFDDDLLRVQREKLRRGRQDSKRRKMVSDLEERERSAGLARDQREEEMISRRLKAEIAAILATHAGKLSTEKQLDTTTARRKDSVDGVRCNIGSGEGNLLKVSMEEEKKKKKKKIAGSYQAFEDSVLEKLKSASQRQSD